MTPRRPPSPAKPSPEPIQKASALKTRKPTRKPTRLTDRFLERGKRGERRDAWDDVVRGLAVRVSPQGDCTFFLRYTRAGKRRRLVLGRYPAMTLEEARVAARSALNEVAAGRDPQGERVALRTAETFAELAELYLERHARRNKRSWREDERMLRKDVLPVWGPLKASALRRRDVIELAEDVAAGASGGRNGQPAPVTANRLIALVSCVFSFAVDQEILEVNPAVRIPRMARERSRERVLSPDELRVLWPTLDTLHPVMGSFWRLVLLTAQRPGEVRRMRWGDLDSDGWWNLPAEFTKNGRAHRVPLPPQALQIVEALRPLTVAGEWVLGSFRKDGAPLRTVHKSTRRLVSATGLPRFTPHDCRRTAATWMAASGTAPSVVDRILNHTPRGVSGVYIRAQDGEVRRALLNWESGSLRS